MKSSGLLVADGFPIDLHAADAHLRAVDQRLARIMDIVGPCRMTLQQTSSVFAALAEAIVYQQLHGKAAATIFGRVCALMPRGRRSLNARNLMTATDEALRGAGLSRNKLLALRDLAERTLSGEVPGLAKLRRMSDEDAIEALTAVRGVGRWTVEMLLIFRLGRSDVLAVDDLGLRQGHAIVLGRTGMTERKALAQYGERWRPYRSVASWYLWRAAELARRH
jgi:3-methyladenine DNA glycosylase/8-oxoguanine DNA glycosylase